MTARRSPAAFAARCSSFFENRRGSLITWAAFLMVPLLGFIGLGVDSARGYMVRARLSQALDSAGLAAGRWTYSIDKAKEEANMVFKANFPDGYMEATVTGPTFDFTNVSAGNDVISVSGTAVIPTYFMKLLGKDTLTVGASTEVTRRTVFMDVVVSLDVSGSMNEWIGSTQKIDAARTAAYTLVDALFGTAEEKELLQMGFVTWNSNARILPIGEDYVRSEAASKDVTKFTNPYNGNDVTKLWYAKNSPVPLLRRPNSSWDGCVRARFLDDANDSNDADARIDYPTLGGKVWKAFNPLTADDTECPAHGTQRLTHKKADMNAAIASVTSGSDNTNMPSGLFWGWTLLGKEGPFAGDETPPPPPGEGELVRALVLMTDGDNVRSGDDAYSGDRSDSELDARAKAIAQAAKDAGVVIYAIRFGAASGAETLLKQIASGPSAPYYQYAPTADALKAAFQEVGNHLSKLRLSR